MCKRIGLIPVLIFICFATCFSQDATVKELKESAEKQVKRDLNDTIPRKWKKGGVYTFNLAQGSLSNWQGGGDNSSFSAVSFLNLFASYSEGKITWDNTLDLGYGYINTTSLGARKSDDRIDLLSKVGYEITNKVFFSALANFRTQFSPGFEYSKDSLGAETQTKTSNYLAPAYLLASLGFNYKATPYMSVYLSPITQRWIIMQDKFLSSIGAYGVIAGKRSRRELGAFLSADFNKEIAKNVVYKSRLDLFSNYKSEPENVDVFWTNVFTLKVNRYLSANVNVDLLYDDNAIGRWQIRQLLGIGFSAKF
jgi:hypothetical protein